jgi:hypothetical protein
VILAVPGAPLPATRALAEETAGTARFEFPGLNTLLAYLDAEAPDGSGGFLTFPEALARAATDERAAGSPAAVVVPLLAGPDASVLDRIRARIKESEVAAELTDVLGPHPLLAEALHVRLSEAGLARADRARLFTVATAADGIILATTGGQEAVLAAGVTGVLLSARLAVPVMAAALDVEGAIARTAEQLRSAGTGRLALAPYVIGPELGDGVLQAAAEAAGCSASAPLGTYPAIGKLVAGKYATALGIVPLPPQGTPAV